VYIAQLKNGMLYVGMTDDMVRPVAEHTQGRSGTRTTLLSPLENVLYKEAHPDRESAMKRERQIKRWTRAKKLARARGDIAVLKELSKSRSRR